MSYIQSSDHSSGGPRTAFQSNTFDEDVRIRVKENVGSASISPSSRDVVLAGRDGLLIIDLDAPYSPPRRLVHHSIWDVADVQWSPFPAREQWIVSTSNQKALVWNVEHFHARAPIELILHAHSRAITDINFSNHEMDMLATCAVDSYVHCWDLRHSVKPAMTFADWNAGATQVKWNRQDPNIIASSHDKFLKIWDKRKGAFPLKTIEAHGTKIYGVDWNETRVNRIVTCSLDRTIKFWDYHKDCDVPERVIKTDFPVWRARHTPFGWGLLAMPQRGNHNLYLYNRRLDKDSPPKNSKAPYVTTFEGHEDNLSEFLWRFRGNIDGGIDNREFQLVSWSSDRYLRLHRMDEKWLNQLGHFTGGPARENFVVTRQGAAYESFRNPRGGGSQDDSNSGLFSPLVGGLTKTFSYKPGTSGLLPSSLNTYANRRNDKAAISDMKWIEGVKIGDKSLGRMRFGHDSNKSTETQESLSEEMMFVSKRYRKVDFEKADVHERRATVSLHGPWGLDAKSIFMRITFEFPGTYPKQDIPEINFERTHSGLSDDILKKIQREVSTIVEHYRKRGRGSFEAVITYLLGEKSMEDSMILRPHDGLDVPFGSPADNDSTDDEEEESSVMQDDLGGSVPILPPQTNVPISRTCGALWTADGRILCFFQPKPEPIPLFTLQSFRNTEKSKNLPRQFEVFGRLRDALSPKDKPEEESDHDDNSSSGSPATDSSSSDESDGISRLPSRFKPPKAWRAAVLKNQRPSSHSSSNVTRRLNANLKRSLILTCDCSELLPANQHLAREYRIFGEGPMICDHNAEVAYRHGQHSIAAVWELCKQIIYDDVPLDKVEYRKKHEPILVIARRNAVRIRRKDSGLDLKFDEPDCVIKPGFTGRVRWGNHPFSSSWLIPELFEHFEKEADIQMLAMLACLFCEPSEQKDVYNSLQFLEKEDLPIALRAPAFSLVYHPTRDVAVSLQQRKSSKPAGAALSTGQFVDYFSRQTLHHGSLGSSNGPPSTEYGASEPHTPFSPGPGATSPLPLVRQATIGSSLSTSPDPNSQRTSRRTQSTFSNALATISRPFINMSSSPPIHERTKDGDMSTSVPANNPMPWTINTSFNSTSPHSPTSRRKSNVKTASFATQDTIYYSTDETLDSDATDDDSDDHDILGQYTPSHQGNAPRVNVTFKNQRFFDDEGFAMVPLLKYPNSRRWSNYRSVYANILGHWSLHIQQAEVLKFNGMPTVTPLIPPAAISPHKSVVANGTNSSMTFHVPRTSTGGVTTSGGSPFLNPLTNFTPSLPDSLSFGIGLTGANGSTTSLNPTDRSVTPLNPAATPFVPPPNYAAHHLPLHTSNTPSLRRVPTSTTMALPDSTLAQGILSVPVRSNTPPLDRGESGAPLGGRNVGLLASGSLLQRATSRARIDLERSTLKVHSRGSLRDKNGLAISEKERIILLSQCVVCWEPVRGLHVTCERGRHQAHMDCARLVGSLERLEEDGEESGEDEDEEVDEGYDTEEDDSDLEDLEEDGAGGQTRPRILKREEKQQGVTKMALHFGCECDNTIGVMYE